MLTIQDYAIIGVALVVSIVIAYITTPLAIRFAKKIGAVDIPKDGRRMHDHPIPLLGGLSIIAAFVAVSICCGQTRVLVPQILPGAAIIAVLGIIDDRKKLHAWPKLLVQCIAAGIAVLSGVRISAINLFGNSGFGLGALTIPITILWIVGITNAVNLIDGLDGLAAGVSTIASLSMLSVALLRGQFAVAIFTAALAGGCIGLLPYNRNPARVFMGDTGATFLGFTLSIISIQGLFKYYAAASFALPLLILGLPIFDTASAIVRRLWEGKSPFSADRNHLHHKLIDMGLSQKQAVRSLYAVSTVLGIIAFLFALFGVNIGLHFLFIGIIFIVLIYVMINVISRRCLRKKNKNPIEPENQADTQNDENDQSDKPGDSGGETSGDKNNNEIL